MNKYDKFVENVFIQVREASEIDDHGLHAYQKLMAVWQPLAWKIKALKAEFVPAASGAGAVDDGR